MYGLPRSFWWFVATAIIFVLQWIPVTGIFLMIMLAPLWSIVTINAGFVSLAFEAATGRTSRLWLIAPVAWFAGYALLSHLSERAYTRLDAEIHAANAQQALAFDPLRAVIAVVDNPNDLSGTASHLVQQFGLPVVYKSHFSDRKFPRANELPSLDLRHTAERIASADICRRLQTDRQLRAARASGHVRRSTAKSGEKPPEGLCAFTIPEEPSLPVYRVEAKAEKLATYMLSGKRVRITITAPDGRRIEVQAGQAAPLSRWPLPVMGCALNSGAPSWDCDAAFMNQSPRGLGGTGAWGAAANEVIAHALGLAAPAAVPPLDELDRRAKAALDTLLAQHERAALANLDLLLADPKLHATVHHLAGLTQRPQLLAQRADAMLVAMSVATSHGSGHSETALNLQRLIAALPEPDFHRIGTELLRRLDEARPAPLPTSRGNSLSQRIDGDLATRLADLGAPAMPILERLAFTPKGNSAPYAILGLCRMTPMPSDLAPRLADHIAADTSSTSDARAAAYVTLMRWSRPDLADRLLDDKGRNHRDYQRRWPSLTPGAGPEHCTFRYHR